MKDRPWYKLISCNVFQRELCTLLAESQALIDPEFLELGLHESPEVLRNTLQARVDEASAKELNVGAGGSSGKHYDAILLGYGLCGNGTAGIQARGVPLVLPRAHDCCTLLLGSRADFLQHFGESLSAPWSSTGFIERGSSYFRASNIGSSIGLGIEYEELVKTYGEENADFVWQTLHPVIEETEMRFIETQETVKLGYKAEISEQAKAEGKDFIQLAGSTRLLRALLAGDWNPEEFLVVPPGATVDPEWDHERIFNARLST